MKFRFYFTVLLISVFQIAQAQSSTDQSITYNPVKKEKETTNISKQKRSQAILSEKEWESVLKKIQKNKARISERNAANYVSKVIDTIYIEMPYLKTDTQLSDW